MIGALIETAIGLGCVATVAAVCLFGVRPALDHRKHERTLANIARLERELGYDVPLETRIDRELGNAPAWLHTESPYDHLYLAKEREVPVSQRIFGQCESCGLRVALNAGRCSPSSPKCAKRIWAERS